MSLKIHSERTHKETQKRHTDTRTQEATTATEQRWSRDGEQCCGMCWLPMLFQCFAAQLDNPHTHTHEHHNKAQKWEKIRIQTRSAKTTAHGGFKSQPTHAAKTIP